MLTCTALFKGDFKGLFIDPAWLDRLVPDELVEMSICRPGAERMPKPEVIESATEIRIAMGVIPPDGAACQIVDGLFLPPMPLWPKSLRIPRPYGRDLMIQCLAFALAVLAMARAAMAVRRWRRANAEVRRWRRAPRDHAS